MLRITIWLCALAMLTGCPTGGDFGHDASAPDAATSDVWRGTTPVFGPCSHDRQCAYAEGVACLTAFPGGLCTRRCDTDSQCGTDGHCQFNVCLPACTSGGRECESVGGACETYYGGTSACVPVCFAGTAPPGFAPCPNGTVCDAYSNACTSTPITSGAENGSACHTADDCRSGLCLLDYIDSDGLPTGYVGGYCYSYGLMPPSRLEPGGSIPQSSCPGGSVVYPFAEPGDLTACYRACEADGDCRAGYFCERFVTLTPPGYQNGICLPISCSDPGRTCPSGTVCVASDAGTIARCGVSP